MKNFVDKLTKEELTKILTHYIKANSVSLTGKYDLDEINIKFDDTINSQEERTIFAEVRNLGISATLSDYFATLTYANAELDANFQQFWFNCLAKKFPKTYPDAYRSHFMQKIEYVYKKESNKIFEEYTKLCKVAERNPKKEMEK